jgi:hypothetical protein
MRVHSFSFRFFSRTLFSPCAVLACCSVVLSGTTARAQETSADPLYEARCSVALKNAPLAQMLRLLGMATQTQFRYAAPPDATVSATLNQAPFLPTVSNVLNANGFDLRRADSHLWVFRRATVPAPLPSGRANERAVIASTVQNLPAWPISWQVWTRSVTPPTAWMTPPAQGRAVAPGSFSVALRSAAPLDVVGWQTLNVQLDSARRPGLLVKLPPAAAPQRVRVRWPLWLRQVPDGAQLLLETDQDATLWVNGAKVWARWQGVRLLDVSSVLQAGSNSLAIEWLAAPDAVPDAPGNSPATSEDETSKIVTTPPVLRYEWLFAGGLLG